MDPLFLHPASWGGSIRREGEKVTEKAESPKPVKKDVKEPKVVEYSPEMLKYLAVVQRLEAGTKKQD